MTSGKGRAAPVVRRVTIVNRSGLHARAAAKFVQTAEAFDAEVVVAKDGNEVLGSSIMGLMVLAAAPGCEIELRGSGPQAEEAVDALERLIANKFDED
jgi:phosphocarrier protein